MLKKKEFLLLIIILLVAGGIFLRDVKPMFAALSLYLILMTDLLFLNKKIKFLGENFTFKRNTDNKIIIRGNSSAIDTEFFIKVPYNTYIKVEDLIPEGAVVDAGSTKTPVLRKSGKYNLQYNLLCLAHGINRFRGVEIHISDQFFTKKLVLHKEDFKMPEIMVYPRPLFLKNTILSFRGKPTERKTIIRGEDVKGLREYNIYDDIRSIDWKASAKYDKLYVKEYSGLETEIRTLFIDLPESEDPESSNKIEMIKGLAGSYFMNEASAQAKIIIISGVNLREIIKSKNIQEDAIRIIEKLNPVTRDRHLYKYSPHLYDNYKGENAFISSLAEKRGYYYKIKGFHLFEKQIYSIFKDSGTSEDIFIITFADKDMSHLNIINNIAGFRKARTICLIPKSDNTKKILPAISLSGFDEVKII